LADLALNFIKNQVVVGLAVQIVDGCQALVPESDVACDVVDTKRKVAACDADGAGKN
jgi:hypothetical protein